MSVAPLGQAPARAAARRSAGRRGPRGSGRRRSPPCRSRLVAAMTRTSTSTRAVAAHRWKLCSCSTRRILPWVSSGMSATSSSSRVPPWARSKRAELARPLRTEPGLAAEQLDVHALRRHGRGVEHDERPLGPPRAGVDQPRHDLLAGAGRARRSGPGCRSARPVAISWRTCWIAGERPISSRSSPAGCCSSAFSRLSRRPRARAR